MLLDNVPPVMCSKACVLAFRELIGKPISVEEELRSRLGSGVYTDLVLGSGSHSSLY